MCDEIVAVYCDGGVIYSGTHGASDFGGTWAYVAVNANDEKVLENSGFHKTDGLPTTNNHTEMISAIYALEAMPDGWSGTLCSDSKLTLGRLFHGWKTKNLPEDYMVRATNALKRLGTVTPKHVKGHATLKELENGISKNGYPVSKWNTYCDNLCQKESKKVKGHVTT